MKKIGKRSKQSGATRFDDFSFSSFYPTAEPGPTLLFYVSLKREHAKVLRNDRQMIQATILESIT